MAALLENWQPMSDLINARVQQELQREMQKQASKHNSKGGKTDDGSDAEDDEDQEGGNTDKTRSGSLFNQNGDEKEDDPSTQSSKTKSTRFNGAHDTANVPDSEQSEQPSPQKDGTNGGQRSSAGNRKDESSSKKTQECDRGANTAYDKIEVVCWKCKKKGHYANEKNVRTNIRTRKETSRCTTMTTNTTMQ